MLAENDLWLLSLYRSSEIDGALFFGRLAKVLRPGKIQIDMTKHFADEAQHASYWTQCIEELGSEPLKLNESYQDSYVSLTGIPANLMEVLAITQVFEQRVVNQYAMHLQVPELPSAVASTLERIMDDERWHLEWVRKALQSLEPEYGRETVQATIRRFREADRDVYERAMREHAERLATLDPAHN